MAHPKIKFSLVSNVWIKQLHFVNAGDVMDGHKHNFDHSTLLGNGSVKVIVNEQETIFTAPTIIFIHAQNQHEFIALEDNTVCYCIHAIRDGDRIEDIVDPKDVPKGSTFFGNSLLKLD